MPSINLASKYSPNIDERFYKESQAMMALNNDFEFTGVQTVKVYSIPVAPMTDYTKSGDHRYGTPSDMTRNVQTLTLNRDRAFSFIIDKGDKLMSQMVSDAGKSLSRQTREVCIPEYDKYVFAKLAQAAIDAGNSDNTAATTSNAYSLFLNAMEKMGNANIPDQGRVCFCSYRFANLLKQDPAFMKYGDKSQEMLIKGVIGEVDGCKIVKVPATRLPHGAAFLMTHPIAATAPKVLEEFKIHDNPPGISGWLVEGRMIYDCFVLNEKRDAIYYQGSQTVLGSLDVRTAATNTGKTTIMVNGAAESGNSFKYKLGTSAASVSYDEALTTGWTALTTNPLEVGSLGSNTMVTVAEVNTTDNKAKAVGHAIINAG